MAKSCKRKDCFAYCKRYGNNCAALSKVYDNDAQCPFFKKPNEVDKTTRELVRMDFNK